MFVLQAMLWFWVAFEQGAGSFCLWFGSSFDSMVCFSIFMFAWLGFDQFAGMVRLLVKHCF